MKKILSSILAMLVVSLSLPHVAWAAAEPIIGTCGVSTENEGKNVVYEMTDEDRDGTYDKVTIKLAYGVTSAAMVDLSCYYDVPWRVSNSQKITTVEIQKGVTNIGTHAFDECTSLTSVTIPDSVTTIGDYAFVYCSSLTSVTIPDSVTTIGDYAFACCTSLTSVTIPDSVTTIGNSAFEYCKSLTSVTIPDSVTTIGDYAFMSCTSLTSVTIPDSVESIKQDAFNNCDALTNVSYLGTADLYDEKGTENNKEIFTGTTPDNLTITVPCNYEDETFFTKPVSKEIHDIEETTIEPTCTESGTKTKSCKNCDYTETETIPALGHKYTVRTFNSNELSLGGTMYKCANCGDEYWTDFTKDDTYAQTMMPNGETVYHYCTHNGLAAETTVDVGDGQTLRVFLQDPLRVLKKNDTDDLGIVVTYVKEGSARYNELMSQVDGDHPIEHIKFFNVYPTVNGVPVTGALDGSIYMEYEIPDGWDEDDLEMILVQDGDDQEFDETVLDIDGKRYLATWKNHFSPYAMIDKLSDEEKAALNVEKLNDEQKSQLNTALENLSDEELAQLKEKIDSSLNENKAEEKSSENQVKTGDETGYIVLMSSALFIIAGLYLELCMKKKRN